MITCSHCDEAPIMLTNGELAHTCYVTGKEHRYKTIEEWEDANCLVKRCGNCKRYAANPGHEDYSLGGRCLEYGRAVPANNDMGIHDHGVDGILCDVENDTETYEHWEPMTMAQYYLTKEKAPYIVINEVMGYLDGKPNVVVKQMYYKGQHIVTIAQDDLEEWLENPHYERRKEI